MLLLAINASLRRAVASNEEISWRSIEEEIAKDFHVRLNYIIGLRKHLFESGVVVVIDPQARGTALLRAAVHPNQKISKEMVKGIATFIDERHSEGRGVVANNIVAYIYKQFNLTIHRTTASRIVRKMGLSWAHMKVTKNSFASH